MLQLGHFTSGYQFFTYKERKLERSGKNSNADRAQGSDGMREVGQV